MNTDRRQSIVTAAMVTPALVLMVVFLAVPLLIVVGYSFSGRDAYGGIVPEFTFNSYIELLQPVYLPIFVNSFQIAAGTTALCILIGYPIAYFIVFRAGRWAPVLLVAMLIPFWINFLIRISAWVVMLGYKGVINETLIGIGLLDMPYRFLGTYGAVMVGMVYAFLPLAVFPIYAALQPIDRRLLEAARDLGAHPAVGFFRVTLPLSLPGVLAAVLFVFVPSMGVFAIPVLLGGGKSIIIGNLIVQLFLEFRNMPLGAAVSVVLLAFSSIGILLYMRAMRATEAMKA
ncbi:MAG: ABC transporter permease [Alphaproteobacteria bacterium]